MSNIPYYAGAFRLAPDARPDDGWLELVLFRGTGRAATCASSSTCSAPPTSAAATSRCGGCARCCSPGRPAPLAQVDGDVCQERLPFTVRLAPERLLVLAPDPAPSVRQS